MHEHTVRVRTASGVVEGFTRDGVHRWRSIPYAKPPVGPLRYRAPVPVQPWSGVRHCHGFGPCAPQQRMYTLLAPGKYQPTSEDCLTLNVVAPAEPHAGPDSGPLPVMVFIHGGGYLLGSSATPIYDGASLARRGCVYVSVNYRLGPLGCLELSSLSTPDHPIDDNLFLRDLVAALRWVRENAAAFGGDPDNVTIFGESAGAHAVATLLATPDAAGLFARAIAQSPSSGMTRSADIAEQYAQRFARTLGAGASDAAEVLMRTRPADLVRALEQLIVEGQREMLGAFAIGPTYDTDYLPVNPAQAMADGAAHRVPLIVGTNADEGKLFTRFLKLLPTTEPAIERLFSQAEPGVRERILAAYPGYPKPSACVRLGGDFIFASAMWQIAEAHGRHAPTYVYRFDYATRALHLSGLGATHAMELLAVFDVYRSRYGKLLAAGIDARTAGRVSDDVQKRWLAFAADGIPGEDWPLYDNDERAVMVLDKRRRVEHDPHAERREVWKTFEFAQ
ncbi:carboxylesterase/lipase family protein [Mycolicibacterium obuense]|uniref:Carboxylic ester hydrolase n=1 Tax=Mycolicibacterium obuense TaxID=1807 RepID=A0A0M2JXK5_9MYCO|nr:carboxylesterase/lipase family protein [Mycolicibacterium obuense]KKE99327.1 carboxylesterase [Mycolicibacterium obuense]TDL08168.1 carboxylesterase/lipase family protein [Mycolicibacterium obuense]